MIKILHIGQLGGGGRERRMVQLIRGLDNTGKYEQSIITFREEIGYKEVLETRAKIYYVTTRDKKQMRKELLKILAEVKPDIVQMWEEEPRQVFPAIIGKLRYHYKFVFSGVADGNTFKRLSKWGISYRLYSLFADKIISNSMNGLIAKRVPIKKSVVIYNGFDYARISKDVDLQSKREELEASSADIVIMVARFTMAKDFVSFVKVAKSAQDDNRNIMFFAIGAGPLLEEIKQYASKLGLNNIKFLGQRRDVEDILQITDVSMLLTNAAAHAEGVSNSIMESMAAGVPVIATFGGGTPEIVTDSVDGFIVESGDYEKAYQKLSLLLDNRDLRNSFSNAAVKRIKKDFLLEGMILKYEEIYNNLLNL